MHTVAGVFYLDGRSVQPSELERMAQTLAHRARVPTRALVRDSVGLALSAPWATSNASLCGYVRRLGQSTTHQLVASVDARLDNRAELLTALRVPCELSCQMRDDELIVAAYQKWGEACSQRLSGDFAFAIWDPYEHKLFCARDHFGVKPFYYYYRACHTFAFASEVKALLALADVPRRLNETRIGDYLLPMLEDKAMTFYQDIWRLPPGHQLVVGRAGMRVDSYWSLDPLHEMEGITSV